MQHFLQNYKKNRCRNLSQWVDFIFYQQGGHIIGNLLHLPENIV